jgi:hypothetical protein
VYFKFLHRLRLSILGDGEIRLRKAGDGFSVRACNDYIYHHAAGCRLQDKGWFLALRVDGLDGEGLGIRV